MGHALSALLSSRKFVVTMAAVFFCTLLVLFGKLPVEHFVDVVAALAAVLTGAIALEDHGKSRSLTRILPITTGKEESI